MGTEGPPVEPRSSPNPADADSPHLLVESVTPLQAPETVLAPPVQQAEFFAQALLEGLEPPTRSQVFELINMLDFKDGSRKDIAVGSSFLLGGYRHGGDYGVMSNTRCFPYTTKVLIAYLLSVQPSHLFCSIAVHSNSRTAMHRDFNNADYPNLICPISEFTGGAIWCESPDGSVSRVHQDKCLRGELHDVSQGPVLLPVKSSFHCTEPWSGHRQVLVAYAGTDVARLSSADYQFLLDLGFPVAGMRGTDTPPSLLHCPSTPGLPEFLQKVSARISKRPLHELICLEVFCGDASLTAEIRKHGLPRSFGVDHKAVSARASVVVLDLSSPSAQAIFLETLRQPNVACCLLSPPCGTTAAARGNHGGPSVLRTFAEPLGVKGLNGCDLKRVDLANCLFSFVAAVLLECHELGVLFSLEHPFRSLLWQIPEIKDALQRLPHAVSDFHHCMFGSQRRKHTKLVHCVPRFSRLQLHCTQDHVHLHQNRLPDGSFASGAETRRPPLLCKLVALSVSEQLVELGALPSPRDLLLALPFMPNPVARFSNPLFRNSLRFSLCVAHRLFCLLGLSWLPPFCCRPKCRPSLACLACLLAPSAFGLFRLGLPWALLHLLGFFQPVRQHLLQHLLRSCQSMCRLCLHTVHLLRSFQPVRQHLLQHLPRSYQSMCHLCLHTVHLLLLVRLLPWALSRLQRSFHLLPHLLP